MAFASNDIEFGNGERRNVLDIKTRTRTIILPQSPKLYGVAVVKKQLSQQNALGNHFSFLRERADGITWKIFSSDGRP